MRMVFAEKPPTPAEFVDRGIERFEVTGHIDANDPKDGPHQHGVGGFVRGGPRAAS